MPILLPVASVCISLILLAGVGTGIGLISGLFGVGGGFLLTPLLIMSGVPATVAAASVSCQMIASSSSGVAAHFRLGNVDIKMGSVLLIGGLAGGGFGVEAIKILRTLGEANLAITLTYIVVLGALGGYMFTQSLRTLRHGSIANRPTRAPKMSGLLARLPWQMDFPHSGVRHSVVVPLVLAVFAGILASVMGVGGGFIMLPLMVYLLGMPTHVAIGTSLFQILVLSAGVTFMQADANHTVDLLLVLPLALSSAVGAQLGARLSRLLRGEQLMILLATLVLAVTGKMAMDVVVKPSHLLAPSETTRRRNEKGAGELAALREQGCDLESLEYASGRLARESLANEREPKSLRLALYGVIATQVARTSAALSRLTDGFSMMLRTGAHRVTGTAEQLWADVEQRPNRGIEFWKGHFRFLRPMWGKA